MVSSNKPCSGRFCAWKDSCLHYIKYKTGRFSVNREWSGFVYGNRTTECIGNNIFKEYMAVSEEEDMRKDRERI